jgi:hypothetical protein
MLSHCINFTCVKTLSPFLVSLLTFTIMRSIVLFFLFFWISGFSQLQPIGQWREHLNYTNTQQVVYGDKIYCATQQAIFSVDENNHIDRYSKANGLSEVGVSCTAWDATTQQLVVAYTNSNIDILKKNNTKNIGDILRSTITGNKTIYHIYCQNGLAYISCGLGIVVIDLIRYEVKDTYFIGSNNTQLKTNSTTIVNNTIYAATQQGIKFANLNANLSNSNSWQTIDGFFVTKKTVAVGNMVIVHRNDSLFTIQNNALQFLYTQTSWQIIDVSVSENKILVCLNQTSGQSKVEVLNSNGILAQTFIKPGTISFPKNALLQNNQIWIADFFGGLSKNTTQTFIPNGPLSIATGKMQFANNTLYVAAGSVSDNFNYLYNRNGIYIFKEEEWSNISYFNQPILDSVLDIIDIATKPNTNTSFAASYGGGLVRLENNLPNLIYKKGNSSLQEAIGDPNNVRVSGLAFDNNQNLWMGNYGAAKQLHVFTNTNQFVGFTIPFSLQENAVSNLVADNANQIWIVSPKGNGLICYNYGNNISSISDDKWKIFRQGNSNGNLPSNIVNCIAKDKNGLIWVGTQNGIAVFSCLDDVFSNNCQAILPIVKQTGFTSFLFSGEEVQSIAVDGANQKWVATKNGVWLVSADGEKLVQHFNSNNSVLLHNNVKSIAINPQNGEVFFATLNGICSYRAIATEATENDSQVLIFPNPVLPNYKGKIAIKNVPENAIVYITTTTGNVVFQTKAQGGQAVWNGLQPNQQPVAAGVYLVFIKEQLGKENLVSKLVVVR